MNRTHLVYPLSPLPLPHPLPVPSRRFSERQCCSRLMSTPLSFTDNDVEQVVISPQAGASSSRAVGAISTPSHRPTLRINIFLLALVLSLLAFFWFCRCTVAILVVGAVCACVFPRHTDADEEYTLKRFDQAMERNTHKEGADDDSEVLNIPVMSFNVRYDGETANPSNLFSARLPRIRKMFSRTRPWIVGLQEPYTGQLRDINRGLRADTSRLASTRYSNLGMWEMQSRRLASCTTRTSYSCSSRITSGSRLTSQARRSTWADSYYARMDRTKAPKCLPSTRTCITHARLQDRSSPRWWRRRSRNGACATLTLSCC